jgi:hypothetical protein
LNTELELSISKLMFLSASVTAGGLEPNNFLMIASCIGNISVCILYLLKRNSCHYVYIYIYIYIYMCVCVCVCVCFLFKLCNVSLSCVVANSVVMVANVLVPLHLLFILGNVSKENNMCSVENHFLYPRQK